MQITWAGGVRSRASRTVAEAECVSTTASSRRSRSWIAIDAPARSPSVHERLRLLAHQLLQLGRPRAGRFADAAASSRPTAPAIAPTPGRLSASSRPATTRRVSSSSPEAAGSSPSRRGPRPPGAPSSSRRARGRLAAPRPAPPRIDVTRDHCTGGSREAARARRAADRAARGRPRARLSRDRRRPRPGRSGVPARPPPRDPRARRRGRARAARRRGRGSTAIVGDRRDDRGAPRAWRPASGSRTRSRPRPACSSPRACASARGCAEARVPQTRWAVLARRRRAGLPGRGRAARPQGPAAGRGGVRRRRGDGHRLVERRRLHAAARRRRRQRRSRPAPPRRSASQHGLTSTRLRLGRRRPARRRAAHATSATARPSSAGCCSGSTCTRSRSTRLSGGPPRPSTYASAPPMPKLPD